MSRFHLEFNLSGRPDLIRRPVEEASEREALAFFRGFREASHRDERRNLRLVETKSDRILAGAQRVGLVSRERAGQLRLMTEER